MHISLPAISAGICVDALQKHLIRDLQPTIGLDVLEIRILLCHALALSRIQLITQSERVLNVEESQRLTTLLQRRINGEPIAYITGQKEFYSLTLQVTPDVLIPRPETELLVELALQHLPQNGSVLDMGTGSGAIAIAIAHTRPDVRVVALDISQQALAVAQSNAMRHQVHIHFLQSDWYSALDQLRLNKPPFDQTFDLILANPPYIAEQDVHLSQGDLRFEPRHALTDHADGLTALRIISQGAQRYLKTGGQLLMEHGYDQAAAVRTLLQQENFHTVQSWRDLAGIERVSGGVKSKAEEARNAS